MYTLFSSGKLSCVFKERLLIIVGSLAAFSGAISIYSQPVGDILPWALIVMGASILAVMVYDRTHSMDTLLAQGAVPDSKRLMALLEKHAEIEEKAKVMLMGRRDRIRHPALRLIIQSLFYDTEKHLKILDAIMHEMKHGGPAPTREANFEALKEAKQGIEDHIWIEQRLIHALEVEIGEADSPVVKMLLSQILEEEKGHHAILLKVFNLGKAYL